jgi:hypothetical protein
MRPARAAVPCVVADPARSTLHLMVTGTPWSGPTAAAPRLASSLSARCAEGLLRENLDDGVQSRVDIGNAIEV